MKRRHIFFIALFAVFSLSTVASCAGGNPPERKDLVHRRFVLAGVDGQTYAKTSRLPDLEFLEDFRVSGSVCNRFAGQGELSGATLTVRRMASTRMLCPDDALNELETRLAGMLQAGAEISLDGNTLTLKQGGHVLVYTAEDRVR